MTGPVRIHVASFNTRRATELCIRTMHRYAGHPFQLVVGDSGSDDGSLELFEALQRDGWLELEQSPGRWQHQDWLDHWLATTPVHRALFCDSDVEFRRRGWLAEMVRTADDSSAALVASEMVMEHRNMIEPTGGKLVRARSRPAPWLMLIDAPAIRALETSFAFYARDNDQLPEGLEIFDVGGWLFHTIQDEGLAWTTMPEDFGRYYRHYGGLSWGRRSGLQAVRARLTAEMIGARLVMARRRQPAPVAVTG
jgi:hypothetical protein